MSGAVAKVRNRIAARLQSQIHATSGSISMFTLLILPVLFIASGAAIDMMRHESARVRLQQALDLCALSSASNAQKLDASTVVSDCIAKLGVETATRKVDIEGGLGSRSVTIEATAKVKNLFIHPLTEKVTTVSASSQAQQRVPNTEVVLVLDISSSMNGRMTLLKDAAKGFVSSILSNSNGRASIAIVPYSSQVYLPPDFVGVLDITDKPLVGTGQCIDFPDSMYAIPGIPNGAKLSAAGFFDALTQREENPSALNPTTMNCLQRPNGYLVPPTDDITKLHSAIDGLLPGGATSIHIGMKWGGVLLSNELQPKLQPLINSQVIPAHFANRPVAYADKTTQKIIVLMTDGAANSSAH